MHGQEFPLTAVKGTFSIYSYIYIYIYSYIVYVHKFCEKLTLNPRQFGSDEGLTLETSALKLLMVANSRYQLRR